MILHPFQHILVISGQWEGDNEMLCDLEPCLWLKRFLPPVTKNVYILYIFLQLLLSQIQLSSCNKSLLDCKN